MISLINAPVPPLAASLLTWVFHGSTLRAAMDDDDFFSSKPQDPLTQVTKQDLGPLSVDELQLRIETLKGEIARVETHMQAASAHKSAAEQLFKK
jgi:uncharacterized small protein (DUF1192 family)